jgi:hypothetical protein
MRMMTRWTIWAMAGVVGTLMCGPALAQQSAAVLKDLTAVIALQGLPCGQVVGATKQADNDYIASCQDGNRYHVFTTAQGRVVVQKQ